MSADNLTPDQSPDELFIERSGDGPAADCDGDADGEAPLCLRVAGHVFPIYSLSEQDFAIALSAKAQLNQLSPVDLSSLELEQAQATPPEQITEQMISGQMFTEDGEVSIPISFSLGRAEGPLLVCVFQQLTSEAARVLRDLVALLVNDWDDEQQTADAQDAVNDEDFDAADSGLMVKAQDPLESELDNSTSDDLSTVESAKRTISSSTASKRLKFGLVSLAFLAVAAILGSRVLTGDPVSTEQPSNQSPSTTQALTTTVPTKIFQEEKEESVRGKIVAKHTLLRSPTAGIVTELFVQLGQNVDSGQPIATINPDVVNTEQRRLTSELNLAQTEEKAAETRLEEANKRIRLAKQQLASDLAALQDALSKADNERQLASRRWKEIEPLAERDNVGRKEVELAKKALSQANDSYSNLQQAIDINQQTLEASDLEERLANQMEISVPSLEADLAVAKARVVYLREQMDLNTDATPPSVVKAYESASINRVLVAAGSRVEVDQAICELQDPHQRLVELNVPAGIASRYQKGEIVQLRLADSDATVSATVEDMGPQLLQESGNSPEDTPLGSQNIVALRLALAPNHHTLPLGTIVVLDLRQ